MLINLDEATTNAGVELLATVRHGSLVGTATYTYVRSREPDADGLVDAALTPRHSAGLVGMWESEDVGRVGLEFYYTGGSGSRRIRTGRCRGPTSSSACWPSGGSAACACSSTPRT